MPACHISRSVDCPIAELYGLIADIEAYPRFVPGWRAVAVLDRAADRMTVRQEIRLGGIRVDFVSTVRFEPPHRIEISSSSHPFSRFHLVWTLGGQGAQTRVEVAMEVAFDAVPLDLLAARLMPRLLGRVVAAFEREARRRRLHHGADHISGGQQ